jgi:transcriptional regulator with XRE-family HTH domain
MPVRGIIEQEGVPETQRAARRLRLMLDVPGLAGEDASPRAVVVHNISAVGALIETHPPLDVGQQITVFLPEAGDVSATVVWQSQALAGCRFARPLSNAALSAAKLQNPLPPELDPAVGSNRAADESFAQRLKRLRRDRGLTRSTLAAKASVSRPSVWAWESGRTTPRRASVLALASALGVPEQALNDQAGADKPSTLVEDGRTSAPTLSELHRLIETSKREISGLAGVHPAHVKIILEL